MPSGASIRVEGIRELNKKLSAAGSDFGQMSELMHHLGMIVIAHAKVPADSGELAGTLRAGKGKTKAVVRAGYKSRGGYAGVVHYGDPHRNHHAQPFLTDALKRSQEKVIAALVTGLDDILKKNNLR